MTGYSDTPLIVTVLAIPKGVTVSGQACTVRVDSLPHRKWREI